MTGSALLLAGGRSHRLGHDKPFVEVGGRPILERLLAATASIDDVLLSVRDAGPFEAALGRAGWRVEGEGALMRGSRRLRLLSDPEPDLGPMAGLAGGLAVAREPLVIVLASDLPFVTPGLVEGLLAELAAAPTADACVPIVAGRPQWLCAAYRRRLAPVAAAYIEDSGGRSVTGFAGRLALRRLGEADLAVYGDPVELTRGVDTPADLAWARERARRGSAETDRGPRSEGALEEGK